ncbi:DUF1134 domain-containing protein [Terrihabitans rhizophilus]|jgi:hypothetical protein|uniref:DUF1134 domain-containing protein n=1 Tax=Terrihabitans rhizophilus TaxID=3092662 RepID=A0ABU4RRF6_9HYPH|nr:DUF1134 domain-containing protein [Terrihabitans sp. PJ23]MDX6807434.1 DUF1134 domain-containing protein [Terrihabitans sp. PJ23]
MTIFARSTRFVCALAAFMLTASYPAAAQYEPSDRAGTYSADEIVQRGHKFFGTVSREMATLVQRAGGQWGEPNGYILGQEGSGAIGAGVRYGEGKLYMKLGGERRVYWQGPSLGFDFGGEGARTMILVYNLPGPEALFRRFAGINGSAYLVGGLGMTALGAGDVVLVPIQSGVGARLGVNVGYLKFTRNQTWNPF